MEPPGGRDSRFNLGYSMNLLSGETPPDIYGRPSTSLQLSPRHTMVSSACGNREGLKSNVCFDERGLQSQQAMSLEACGVNDIDNEPYNSMQSKKSPPSNGKKTKGRVKIKMEYIENKLRRYTTFSKRKTGIMKKAYELSTLTGTQVMLLVASETGHVYTFATRKLQPMITSEAGKALIQTCLNSPDPPAGSASGDQRMSATGFEETELTYNISDEDSKEYDCCYTSSEDEEMAEDEPETSLQDPKSSLEDCSVQEPPKPKAKHKSLPVKVAEEDADSKPSAEPIIKQIEQINNALLMSNMKAMAGTAQPQNLKPSLQMPPLQPLTSSATVAKPVAPVPLLVQTAGGLGLAALSNNMILGMVQSKLVAMPLTPLAKSTVTLCVKTENDVHR